MKLLELIFLCFITSLLSFPLANQTYAESNTEMYMLSLDGNNFHLRCSSEEYTNQGWCLGYTSGISDGIALSKLTDPENFPSLCIPNEATVGQKKDVILDYIERNPADRHIRLALLAFSAWNEAWPC